MKKRLAMLAPHEPTLDPRIDWEATAASSLYETVVLGLHEEPGGRPDRELRNGYEISRAATANLGDAISLAQALVRAICTSLVGRALAWLALLWFALLGAICSLMLLVAWLIARVVTSIVRMVRRSSDKSSSARAAALSLRAFLLKICSPSVIAWLAFFYNVVRGGLVLWHQLRLGPTPPDLVHGNDVYALLPAFAAKQRYGCPIVYDSHELWPHQNVQASRWQVALMTWYERHLSRWADAVVTVSPQLARELEQSLGLQLVHVVPNAEPWSDTAEPDRTAEDGRPDARVKFLFQGVFAPDRGIAELLQAWRHVPADKAVLLLRGPESAWRREAQDLAAKLGLLDRSVLFPPAVSEDELVVVARQADVGVIPYKPVHVAYRYACPNKLSQYMHAGLAILSNDLPFVRQVVAEADCGLVYDSADETSIREAVLKLVDNVAFRNACRRNAREYARGTFNWQNYGSRLLEIYAALTAPAIHAAAPVHAAT